MKDDAGALMQPEEDGDESQRAARDRNITAMEAYSMEVETAGLVRLTHRNDFLFWFWLRGSSIDRSAQRRTCSY